MFRIIHASERHPYFRDTGEDHPEPPSERTGRYYHPRKKIDVDKEILLNKSIFDLYRGKLAEALGINIKKAHHASREELEEEKHLWKECLYYYLDYEFIKKGM